MKQAATARQTLLTWGANQSVGSEDYVNSEESLEENLIVLLQHQLEEKQQKSIERRIKRAKFPLLKTLDTFQFDGRLPHLKKKLVRELVSCE